MKFRWKLALTTMGVGSAFAVGAWLATPTSVDASISPEQKERMLITSEIGKDISFLAPKLDPGIKDIYVESIYAHSRRVGVDPTLVTAIIYRESEFNPMAVSSADCVGAMQVNPKAHKERIKNITINELFYIDNNIKIGCDILKDYSTGGVRNALRRYVGGAHPTYVNDVLSTYAVLKLEEK